MTVSGFVFTNAPLSLACLLWTVDWKVILAKEVEPGSAIHRSFRSARMRSRTCAASGRNGLETGIT